MSPVRTAPHSPDHWGANVAASRNLAAKAPIMNPLLPGFDISLALQATGIAALLAAGLHDICSRQIPNHLVLVVLGLGALNLAITQSTLLHLAGFLVVFTASVACWRQGWLGGGDTKLLAAAVLLVPAMAIPQQILAIAMIGGGMAIAVMLARFSLPAQIRPAGHGAWTPLRIARIELWRIQHGVGLPYAVAIALGTAAAVLACRVAAS
jgi:Flp pilus assembly protein protease CpaA